MITAVVYDIDNTLTTDVSWLKITELLGGSASEHKDIFDRFTRDEIPYHEAKQRLVSLWQATGKANKAYWQDMFADWPLKHDAQSVVRYTLDKGYSAALITGSLDLFAERVAHKLQIPHWYANTTTVWDTDGKLVDFHYVRDQAAQKLIHLQEFTRECQIDTNACVVVGDGDNDVEIFKATGHGIAVNSDNASLLEVSWKQIHELSEIKALL